MTRARWIAGGMVGLALIAHVLFYFNQTCDDVFISLRYVHNFAAGHGLTFNPGLRDEGYSNLSWVLILAFGSKLGADVLILAKLLSLAAALGIMVCLAFPEWVDRSRDATRWPLAAALLALSPHFSFWCASGLETVFFSSLIVALVGLASRSEQTPKLRALVLVLAALAAWTRPEGALLGVLVSVHELIRGPTPRRKQALLVAGAALLAFAAQTLFRLGYYGALVSNPYLSKVAGVPWSVARIGFDYVIQNLREMGGVVLVPLASCAILLRSRDRQVSLAATVLVGYLGFFVIPSGGDYMRGARFLIPVVPLLFLLCEIGAAALADKIAVFRRPVFALLLASSVVISSSLIGDNPIPRVPSFFQTRAVAPHNAHRRVADWLNANTTPTSSAVLSEMGAIPYYTQLRYYDYWGLVDRRVYRQGSLDVGLLLGLDPDLAVLTRVIGQRGGRMPIDSAILFDRRFRERYEEVARIPILRDEDEESSRYYLVSPTTRPDQIEFVIFRRRS